MVSGHTDPRFEAVKEAFQHNFATGDELGAALCVIVEGHVVVDLAGGWTDVHRNVQWSHDTLVNAFSVGKGVLAILLAQKISEGVLALDTPVANIWPQLKTAQDAKITVADLAAHRAALPAIRSSLAPHQLYEWSTICHVLEEQTPWWEPGTAHGYHVNTYGFLMGEVICRSSQISHAELLSSLRHIVSSDVYYGVPTGELHRVADLEWNDVPSSVSSPLPDHGVTHETTMKLLTYANPPNFSGIGSVNETKWRQAVHPSTNIHATARGVARIYDSVRSTESGIHADVIDECTRTHSFGHDLILESETHFGAGFQLPTSSRRFGPHNNAFGHYGAGGAVGFYDPTTQTSVGYVMNKMGRGWQNSRNQTLINALYSCL